MDRKKALFSVGALVALILVIFLVVFTQDIQQNLSGDASATYRDSHTYVYGIGQTATLDSDDDEEGVNYGWYAGFDWDGIFTISIDKVKAYRDSNNKNDFTGLVGVDGMKLISDYPSPVAYVEVSLRISNINAAPRSDEDTYNASIFFLNESITAGDIPLVNPGKAALDNPGEKDGYKYYLDPGEDAIVTIGWFIEESSLNNDLTLIVGSTGNEKYSFKISPSDLSKE